MKRLYAYSLFAVLALGQGPAGMVDELRDRQTLIQVRVIPPQDLTVTGAMRIGKAFLSEEAGHKLKVLTMYADSAAAAEEVANCEGSYKQWKILYDGFPKVQFRAAQLISTGDDAVLSVRTDDGGVSRQVLRGTDPTKFEIDGVPFEILFIAGRTRSKFEGCGAGAVEPVLFLKTSTDLTLTLCERATARLARNLGVSHLSASFRNDLWFLCSQFPVFYPFSPPGLIPTETAYRNTVQFTCYMSCDGVPKCGLTSGTPTGKSQSGRQ